ncbi:MAG: hypothetical protein ACKV2O_12440 [Acidimicrobiales bacterium]
MDTNTTPAPHQPQLPLGDAIEHDERRRRSFLLVIVAAVLALLASAGAVVASGGWDRAGGAGATSPGDLPTIAAVSAAAPKAVPAGQTNPGADHDADPAADTAEDDLDAGDDSQGYPDGGGTAPEPPEHPEPDSGGAVELEPVNTSPSACADTLATGAKLLVTPEPADLPSGVMTSSLSITNCGDGPIDWTAATKPTVSLAHEAGNLDSGSSTQLDFVIDSAAYEPGAITFKIKVSEPGHNHYVDVNAFRELFGKELVPAGLGLSGGEGAGGCANQCITSALLTKNFTSPNLGLEVKTHTPATIAAFVSKQAPVADPKGNPSFPGKAPIATSGANAQQWTTSLAPLQPATKYYLILKATDTNARSSYRSTSFTTITPVQNPGNLAPNISGCALQCVTSAILTPGADATQQSLAVKSTIPARFMVWVSSNAPQHQGNIPHFGDAPAIADSGAQLVTEWSANLNGLTSDHTYHIIVRASDAQGQHAYRVGQFHTAKEQPGLLLMTIERIRVTYDGDHSDANRGELSFAWGNAGQTWGTRGEHKMHAGDVITLGGDNAKSLVLAQGFLPTIFVTGSERDADGLSEFCTAGEGVSTDPGHNDSCDTKWNVAGSGIVSAEQLDSLPRCGDLGLAHVANAACMVFETANLGDDYARFQVIVSLA